MKTILIIDDNNWDRQALQHILEKAGYKVIALEAAVNVNQLISAEQVDLVITDMVMPGQDGLQTITEIRQLYADLPIIAISGAKTVQGHNKEQGYMAVSGRQILHHFPADYKDQLETLKLCGFLQKPCSAEKLISAVETLFSEEP